MRAIVLHGSPRRGGNSDTLADYFIQGLKSIGNVEVFDFILNDMKIRPCQGCQTCMTAENHKCIIDDDMHQIYSVFGDADFVVWATPMYWGYMTAQMKIALDRMEALALDPEKYWLDKEFIALLTYRHHYQSTVEFFVRIQNYFRFKLNVIEFCSLNKISNEDLDASLDKNVSADKEKLEESYQLGRKLGVQRKALQETI
jgi:multimeric flavodoxin WrbA